MKSSKFFVASLFLITVFLVSICSVVYSQEWHTTNQATITWDAVTGAEEGAPYPETDVIEYRVWLSNAITDPDKTNPVEIGITAELVYVVTLNVEGRFLVGLQTIRKQQQGSELVLLGESEIGWSDDPEIVADGRIFGLQYYLSPPPPRGVSLL